MSTKSTIAHGDGFHLYSDLLFSHDRCEDHVWLELEQVEFEADNRHIAVKVPIAIWEYLRMFPGVDLSSAQDSDEDIRAEAEAWAERCVQEFASMSDKQKKVGLAMFSPLGPPESAKTDQVARAFEILINRRNSERKVIAAIEALKACE